MVALVSCLRVRANVFLLFLFGFQTFLMVAGELSFHLSLIFVSCIFVSSYKANGWVACFLFLFLEFLS